MKRRKQLLNLTIGAIISAVGINLIAGQNIVFGGASGLAIIVQNQFKIPISITSLLINMLLFILGWKLIGKDFLQRSLFTVIVQSFFLQITQTIQSIELDMLLASVYGGILLGIGVGIVIEAGGSTGGTDMLALIINHYWGKSISNCMFVIDALIISFGFFSFGFHQIQYALIVIFFITKAVESTKNRIKSNTLQGAY